MGKEHCGSFPKVVNIRVLCGYFWNITELAVFMKEPTKNWQFLKNIE